MQKLSLALIGAALASGSCTSIAADSLPVLNLDTEHLTVSGLSSGGFMATQYHIANSDKVIGAAMLASGPYYCATNDIGVALERCVSKVDTPIDVNALNAQAKKWADSGAIAPLEGLKNSNVWLFHGTADARVNSKVSDALFAQYQQWVPETQLTYVNDQPFAHVFPTLDQGGSCTESASPYVGKCEYDAAGELLNALLGELTPPDESLSGTVVTLDQQAIAGDNASTMGDEAYAYIPADCAAGEACRVHVSFHGCNQYADAVNLAYVEQTGLNRWADDNQIVVLYPQTKKSLLMPMNPQGCWDWWGYTGDQYATKNGPQLKAVDALISHLAKR